MTRFLSLCFVAVAASLFLGAQATAGPHLLPRIHIPKINLGKAVGAATYPVTKSVINGGKTVLKTASRAETLGVMPSIGPSAVNNVAKKIIVGIGGH